MPPRLTPLRQQFLLLIARFQREHDRPPTASELAVLARLSPSTLSAHLKALTALGYVQRATARGGLLLTESGRAAAQLQLPLYGDIAAGPPLLAEQAADRQRLSLDELLGLREGDFILRVRGDSMIGAGIFDGDYVIVRPTQEILNDEIAVVLLPGENTATLKRVTHMHDRVALISENPAMPRLDYPADQVQIQGRMVARAGRSGPRRPARRA